MTPRIYASDEIQYFSYLRSLWFDRDVSFENEYQLFLRSQHRPRRRLPRDVSRAAHRRRTAAELRHGRLCDPVEPVLRDWRTAGAALGRTPADGFSRPYVAAVAYGSAFYGFVAILLSIAAARRRLRSRSPPPASLVWLGTPLLFYMYVAPPFSHACSAFAVALFVTVWLQRAANDGAWAAPSRSGCRRADGDGAGAGHVPGARARRVDFFAATLLSRRLCSITQSSRGPIRHGSLALSRSAGAAGAADTHGTWTQPGTTSLLAHPSPRAAWRSRSACCRSSSPTRSTGTSGRRQLVPRKMTWTRRTRSRSCSRRSTGSSCGRRSRRWRSRGSSCWRVRGTTRAPHRARARC